MQLSVNQEDNIEHHRVEIFVIKVYLMLIKEENKNLKHKCQKSQKSQYMVWVLMKILLKKTLMKQNAFNQKNLEIIFYIKISKIMEKYLFT